VFPVPENVEKARPALAKVDTQKGPKAWLFNRRHASQRAVEFKDYVALVECPLNDERALAVIRQRTQTIPNKPIRYVINSHHHFDHSGGLRACVAEGATIITYADNKPYYEKAWAMPHTLIRTGWRKSEEPVIEPWPTSAC